MAGIKKRFTFTWKIENFSMLPHQNGESLDSEKFVVDIWKETEWYLKLYPRGDELLESGGYVSLYFGKNPADTELKINFSFALESTDSTSEVNKGDVSYLTETGLGYPAFISLTDINKKKNLFLPNDILTLRFELGEADENSASEKVIDKTLSSQYSMTRKATSRTSILVHRRSMMWPIKKINKRKDMQEHSIIFTNVLKKSPSLKISCNLAHPDFISIEIRQTRLARNKERLFVKCKLTVIDAHKECRDSAESTHLFSLKLDDVFNFPSFIKINNLTNDKYLYLDDTLLLQCEFSFSYKGDIYHSEFNCAPLSVETKKLRIKTKFFKSLEEHYMDGKFCDIRLQAGDKVFPAVKILLCARSSVFTAMFELDMKEKISNVVEITDIEPTTLKRMLDFIHVDAVNEELSHEDACKLYKAADKYNIECLKRMYSILLTSALSVSNVCDVLALADAHNDKFLMNAVHTFISTYSTETFHSNHWETFMEGYPKLSMKIMHQWIKGQQF